MKVSSLHPDHLKDLELSGLTPETIRGAGIYTVSSDEIGRKLGKPVNGFQSALAFPYPGCNSFERFKVWWKEGKEEPSYLQARGTPNHLYIPPGTETEGDSPLLVTEGEKNTLALRQAGFQVIGIPGAWGWCLSGNGYRNSSEPTPIPDLDKINWKRDVTIVFDSEGLENRKVRRAVFSLSRELSRRGATVFILLIPPKEDNS